MDNNIDTAVIFAAGLGSRMGQVTQEIPKPLARINKSTLLDLVVKQITASGIKKIMINVHYKAACIIEHIVKRDNCANITIIQEASLLETGGSLANLLDLHGIKSPVLTCNVDTIWTERDNIVSQIKRLLDAWPKLPDDKLLLMLVSKDLHGAPPKKDFRFEGGRLWVAPDPDCYYIGSQIIDPRLLKPYRDQKKFSLAEVYMGMKGDSGFMSNAYAIEFAGQDVFHVGDQKTLEFAIAHSRNHEELNW